jgi:hypothetical protein
MTERFLDFISRLQHDNQPVQKARQKDNPMQLDLFSDEYEILGNRIGNLITRDVVISIQEAGGDLATLEIQAAVSAARGRAIDLLKSALAVFAPCEMRPRRN